MPTISNNKLVYFVVVILILSLAYFAYAKLSKSEVKNIDSIGTDIVAMGDSLVAGNGASSKDTNFVSLVSAKIGNPIINLGVPGNTSTDLLARLNELDRYNPKVVILLVGGNDFLQKVPKETTFKNIEKIVQNIQARGSSVLLLGIRGGILKDNFATEFERIAEKYNTAYVSDVLSGLITKNQYMSDTIHPNDAGYKIIADRVYSVLVKMIN